MGGRTVFFVSLFIEYAGQKETPIETPNSNA